MLHAIFIPKRDKLLVNKTVKNLKKSNGDCFYITV